MSKSTTIYVSLPLAAARSIRKLLLKDAARAAKAAAQDPTDEAARKRVAAFYYTVDELDRKLKEEEATDE